MTVNLTTPLRHPVTVSFAEMLKTGTGRSIGVGRSPVVDGDALAVPDFPYAIVYPVAGGGFSGSLAFPDEDAAFEFQVTGVGLRLDQADWMTDKVRSVVLGRSGSGNFLYEMTVTDHAVVNREPTGPPGAPVESDNVWSVAASYYVRVSTA